MTEMTDEAVMIELNRIKTDTYPTTDFDRRDAALERAKQAVRKQIPRKLEPDGHFAFMCCVCGARHCTRARFCRDCGQALDWE